MDAFISSYYKLVKDILHGNRVVFFVANKVIISRLVQIHWG